jgi:HAD superfamily hydrolase (TIGR01459 family)
VRLQTCLLLVCCLVSICQSFVHATLYKSLVFSSINSNSNSNSKNMPSAFGVSSSRSLQSSAMQQAKASLDESVGSETASTASTATATTTTINDDTMTNKAQMKYINGIGDIINEFDVFILDMWGVMHDGFTPYQGVVEVVNELCKHNKRLIILSNSSKRKASSIKMLNKLGFDPNHYSAIITSGEVAYHMLAGEYIDKQSTDTIVWNLLTDIIRQGSDAKKAFCFGSGAEDEAYLQSCGWSLAPVEEASLIVARGTFTINNGKTVIDKNTDETEYNKVMMESLNKAASRRLPMLVCNPDKIRPDVHRPPMPGKIGDDYEAALGGGPEAEELVKRIGKPLVDVYDLACVGMADRSRVCMVGDSLETDVTGGTLAGIQTIWVIKDGVHGPDLTENGDFMTEVTAILDSFNTHSEGTYAKGRRLTPDYVVPHFRW